MPPFLSFRVSIAAAVSESQGSFLHFPELDLRIHKPAYADVCVCVYVCVFLSSGACSCLGK